MFNNIVIFCIHILELIVWNKIRNEFLDTTNFQKPFRTFDNRICKRQGLKCVHRHFYFGPTPTKMNLLPAMCAIFSLSWRKLSSPPSITVILVLKLKLKNCGIYEVVNKSLWGNKTYTSTFWIGHESWPMMKIYIKLVFRVIIPRSSRLDVDLLRKFQKKLQMNFWKIQIFIDVLENLIHLQSLPDTKSPPKFGNPPSMCTTVPFKVPDRVQLINYNNNTMITLARETFLIAESL